jgi:gamma-glutamyltranspeptidase/glutathione hydrolase
VTVPGAIAGWRLYGLSSAHCARRICWRRQWCGRRTTAFRSATSPRRTGRSLTDKLDAEPNAASTYLPQGRAPRAGEIFRNTDLATSLGRIATRGAAGFYEGPTAEAILAISKDKGGTMSAGDLRDFKPEWVEPISTTYRGWTVYELPPNTQGIAALMMLNMMEHFPLAEYGFHSARALHVMIEAKKLAYADMLRYVGDVRFSRAPIDRMLDKAHAASRARQIEPRSAARDVQPSFFDGLTNSSGHDTVYLGHRPQREHCVAYPEHLPRVRHGHRPARRRLRAP